MNQLNIKSRMVTPVLRLDGHLIEDNNVFIRYTFVNSSKTDKNIEEIIDKTQILFKEEKLENLPEKIKSVTHTYFDKNNETLFSLTFTRNDCKNITKDEQLMLDIQLNEAVGRLDLEVILQLLYLCANPDYRVPPTNFNALDLLITKNTILYTSILLYRNASVNFKGNTGNSPLHTATSMYGSIEMVKFLINNEAIINFQNQRGNTPLHNAVDYEHVDIVEYLINKNADINIKNINGDTALDLALKNKNQKIIDLFGKTE